MAFEPRLQAIRLVALALIALATATTELAIADAGGLLFRPLLVAAAWTIAVAAVTWIVERRMAVPLAGRARLSGKPPPLVATGIAGFFLFPLLLEPARRKAFGEGFPMEILLLMSLRNLGLALAAFSAWPLCLRLTAPLSLFLILVASTITSGTLVLGLLGAYAAAASLWLMLAYWSNLRWQNSATMPGRIPLLGPVMILALLGSMAAAAMLGPGKRLLGTLFELLPSSGGTTWYDPASRGGIHDGDDEVRGTENAESVGFTDSDIFLDSPQSSLYDAVSDLYGEPFKPKEWERAIALDLKVKEPDKIAAENLRAGREFPLLRHNPKPHDRLEDRAADALLYVHGKTPLHLRLVAYDQFDGITWQEGELSGQPSFLENDRDWRWLRPFKPAPNILAGTESHQIKVALLQTSPLPIPTHVKRFKMGRVNRPDFFSLAQEEILCLSGRSIPSSTMIETETYTVDPRLLDQVAYYMPLSQLPPRYFQLPDGLDPRVRDLARQWAGDHSPGWGQVMAVVARLRAWGVHDHQARLPLDCRDGVGHFLLKSRRGPDYLFASAAAVMLRSLGYSTRLVSGFYVSPDRYDSKTRHTPVLVPDAHFWAEVQLPSGAAWVAIEPTPGYELMGPALSWTDHLLAGLQAAWNWVRGNTIGLAAAFTILMGLVWRRHNVFDLAATLCWRLRATGSWQGCVLRTVRLLERRARWAGWPRPPGQTLGRWYGATARRAPAERGKELQGLVQLADRAAYAPESESGRWAGQEREVRGACRQAVHGWTLTRFRELAKKRRGMPA